MTVLRARVLSPAGPDAVTWLPDARVVLHDGRIAEVGPWSGGTADEDLRDGVLTPGFVDAHVHAAQVRIVGAASGPLLDWLRHSTFPEEAGLADDDRAAAVARVFAAATAAAGTTLTLAYGSVHPDMADALFAALDARGLKAIAGPSLMDEPSAHGLHLDADAALDALDALVDRWHGRDGRLEVAVIPRFALSCTPGLMRRAADLARRRGLVVSTHLAEHPDEVAAVRARYGARYLAVYDDLGLVHERTVLAHCIHLSDAEWTRLAEAGATVAHCPDSNAFLGSGDMPVEATLGHGVRLALGTDVAAGRSFRVPRIASAAHDNALRRGLRVPPARWLWTATRGAALALHHAETGAVEVGLDADLVLHDVPEWVEDADGALAWVLFAHDAPWARITWVRGRKVWTRPGPAWPW